VEPIRVVTSIGVRLLNPRTRIPHHFEREI